VLASVAQWERRIIGERTREALAAKRQQGVRLGRPRSVPDTVVGRIRRADKRGRTLTEIAKNLNSGGVPTARGGRCWYPATVRQVLLQSR
jgi:DNA invertase Pin-like site-specific DNA recombinase